MFGYHFFFEVEGSEEEIMQARPVYVAAIDLSCKSSLHMCINFVIGNSIPRIVLL